MNFTIESNPNYTGFFQVKYGNHNVMNLTPLRNSKNYIPKGSNPYWSFESADIPSLQWPSQVKDVDLLTVELQIKAKEDLPQWINQTNQELPKYFFTQDCLDHFPFKFEKYEIEELPPPAKKQKLESGDKHEVYILYFTTSEIKNVAFMAEFVVLNKLEIIQEDEILQAVSTVKLDFDGQSHFQTEEPYYFNLLIPRRKQRVNGVYLKYKEPQKEASSILFLTDLVPVDDPQSIVFYRFGDKAPGLLGSFINPPRQGGGSGFGAARSDKPGDYRWFGDEALGYALGLGEGNWRGGIDDTKAGGDTFSDVNNNTTTYYKTNTPARFKLARKEVVTEVNPVSKIMYFKKGPLEKEHKRNTYRDSSPKENEAINPRLPSVSDNNKLFKRNGNISITKPPDPLPNLPETPSLIFKKPIFQKKGGQQKLLSQYKPGPLSYFIKKAKEVDVRYTLSGRDNTAQKVAEKVRTYYKERVKALEKSTLSANDYVDYILSRGNDAIGNTDPFKQAVEAWKERSSNNKTSKGNAQRLVDQEWCHLYGHALGGDDIYANFVSGSHYCNTEQLAMEMAVRGYSNLKISVSAYRLGDTEIALWMRYKIYYKDKKIFDHIFDGQSESFDYNEYKILETTVRRVIAEAMKAYGKDNGFALDEYQASLDRRAAARKKKEEKDKPSS